MIALRSSCCRKCGASVCPFRTKQKLSMHTNATELKRKFQKCWRIEFEHKNPRLRASVPPPLFFGSGNTLIKQRYIYTVRTWHKHVPSILCSLSIKCVQQQSPVLNCFVEMHMVYWSVTSQSVYIWNSPNMRIYALCSLNSGVRLFFVPKWLRISTWKGLHVFALVYTGRLENKYTSHLGFPRCALFNRSYL